MSWYFTHATVMLPDQELADASVLIDDGRVIAIAPEHAPAHAIEYDCRGAWLLPGLIDLHCDALEKEIAPRPKVLFPLDFAVAQSNRRNVAAGVTTPFHAVSFAHDEFGVRNGGVAAEVARALRRRRGLVDNRIHCRYEVTDPHSVEHLAVLFDSGHIDLLSLMDHTPGQGQFKTMAAYAGYMIGAYHVTTAQAEAMAASKVAAQSGAGARIQRLIKLARAASIPIPSHDDDSAERVTTMVGLGAKLSEFPTDLGTAHAARAAGMATIFGAPNVMRGQSQSGNMRAIDASTAGAADCLCSDYHPATLLEAACKLPEISALSLVDAVRLVGLNPARAAGLTDRGEIAVGRRADLICVRRDQGVAEVAATMVAGRMVFRSDANESA